MSFATKKTLIKDPTEIRDSCSWKFVFGILDHCTARQAQRPRRSERFDNGHHQQVPTCFCIFMLSGRRRERSPRNYRLRPDSFTGSERNEAGSAETVKFTIDRSEETRPRSEHCAGQSELAERTHTAEWSFQYIPGVEKTQRPYCTMRLRHLRVDVRCCQTSF